MIFYIKNWKIVCFENKHNFLILIIWSKEINEKIIRENYITSIYTVKEEKDDLKWIDFELFIIIYINYLLN